MCHRPARAMHARQLTELVVYGVFLVSKSFEYDVFLSHSSNDKVVARELGEQLKATGLRVWLDEWIIKPGDSIPLAIERGLEDSRTLVLMMSRHAFSSEWVTMERHTALFRDPTNQSRRFIPVRLDDSTINDSLRQFAYVDWRTKDKTEYLRLLGAIQQAAAEHEKDDANNKPGRILSAPEVVGAVAITPDAERVFFGVHGFDMGDVYVWDLATGDRNRRLKGHTKSVNGLALTRDGQRLLSSSGDGTLRVWNVTTGECIRVLSGHTNRVRQVTVTQDDSHAFSIADDNTLRVWDLQSYACTKVLRGSWASPRSVAIGDNGAVIIVGSADNIVRVLDTESGSTLQELHGHTASVNGIAMTSDGSIAISASNDCTLRLWDIAAAQCRATLEGHTGKVNGVAVTPNGSLAVSASSDGTVRIWDISNGTCLAALVGDKKGLSCVAITDDGLRIASGANDTAVRIWETHQHIGDRIRKAAHAKYTNAKVLLVGDSGVGKSGLSIRLSENKFESTISTDACWATQLKLPGNASTEGIDREIWLWDFAGQADYRLIHQLFMDEAALAVLVFNPQHDNPFEGLGQWDNDLARAARRKFRKLLVAGRCDRGGLMVSRAAIRQFADARGFVEFLETSARTGEGCKELKQAILDHIDWSAVPWTASPQIFKLLKEEILKMRDEGIALLRLSELKQQLEMRLLNRLSDRKPSQVTEDSREDSRPVDLSFTIEELRAVIGLLAGPGLVWQLEFGDFILLSPDRINAYAAAVIRRVRKHREDIGCIFEHQVLKGDLDFQDLDRLNRSDEDIILRAMHQMLVDRGICMRVPTDAGELLVFPSYFKRERPELGEHPGTFVTYCFNGNLDDIYATLAVRLHHTSAFVTDQLWRYAIDFKTESGSRLGIKMTKKTEGAGEIDIYLDSDIPDDTRATFVRYVHEHLLAKASNVNRIRYYYCEECTDVIPREAIDRGIARNRTFVHCPECGSKVTLLDIIEHKFASDQVQRQVHELDNQATKVIGSQHSSLVLASHAFAVAKESSQQFNLTRYADGDIDAEIEFTDLLGKASGQRCLLLLKTDGQYFAERGRGTKVGAKIDFIVQQDDHFLFWRRQPYPVMLVRRTSSGEIEWMNISEFVQRYIKSLPKDKDRTRQPKDEILRAIPFDGHPFTAISLRQLRDSLTPSPVGMHNANRVWRSRLAHLRREEQLVVDVEHKALLKKHVEEAEQRILQTQTESSQGSRRFRLGRTGRD